MKFNKSAVLFYVGMICAIWFALTGWLWLYWAALFIAYPFGLVGFIVWLVIKKYNQRRATWLARILIAGLIISLFVLSLYK